MAKRGFIDIMALLIALVFVLIFVNLIPTVSNSVVNVAGNGSGIAGYGNANVTGASNALVSIMPLIFVAIGIIALVSMFGVMGSL